MPTGYTYYIESGKIDNAKDFLMLCLRSSGACIEMRDEPFDKPIPDIFAVNDYYLNEVKKTRESIDAILKNNNDDFVKEINSRIEYYNGKIEEDQKVTSSYKKILGQLNSWNPEVDYVGVKNFAIDQIRISMDDSMSDYYEKEIRKLEEEKNDLKTYKIKKLEELNNELRYFLERLEKETDKVSRRNLFLKGFREAVSEL